MVKAKIQCVSCGFSFPEEFIRYHSKIPYCDICSLDLLLNQRSNYFYLPSYYLSRTHQENFMLLLETYSRTTNFNWYSAMVAYVLSIPVIYEDALFYRIKSQQYESFFKTVPFIWQFDFMVMEFKESDVESHKYPSMLAFKIRKDTKGFPIQNRMVRDLSSDCRTILKLGYYLQFDFFTVSEIRELILDEYPLLSLPYQNMAEEMVRFTQVMREHFVK